MIPRKYMGIIVLHSMKSILLHIPRFNGYSLEVFRNSSFKSVYRDKLDGVASYTLQSRLIKYLRTDEKYKKNSLLLDRKENFKVVIPKLKDNNYESSVGKLLGTLTDKQLSHFICQLGATENVIHGRAIKTLVQKCDEECCDRLKNMDRRNLLQFLDAWFYVLPNRLHNLQFYSLFAHNTSYWIPVDNYSIEDVIHLMFYISLQKKTTEGKKAISICLQKVESVLTDEIALEELCIVTSAAYKTSCKITSSFLLNLICSVINSNMKLISDEAIFVTYIKCLRHAQFHDYDLMGNMAHFLTSKDSPLKNLNFTTKVHLLALYADALFSSSLLIQPLIQACVNNLSVERPTGDSTRSSHLTIGLRVKDITRFLWAVSNIGYSLDNNIMDQVVVPQLMDRLNKGEYSKSPEEIVNSLLFVWMLGHRPEELFIRAVTKEAIGHLKSKKGEKHYRNYGRLLLLLKCVEIEMPHLLTKEHFSWIPTHMFKVNLEKHIHKRPLLQKVYMKIKSMSNCKEIKLEFSIPNLFIAGIVVENISGAILHIEVLDSVTCLYKSNKPHGMMHLKLHLLKAMEKEVLTINEEQFGNLADRIFLMQKKLSIGV